MILGKTIESAGAMYPFLSCQDQCKVKERIKEEIEKQRNMYPNLHRCCWNSMATLNSISRVLTISSSTGLQYVQHKQVVLWELPPSFCALVQRASRAVCDFNTLGEAILIVPQSVIMKGTTKIDVEVTLGEVESEAHMEAENYGEDELASLDSNGI
jgi:hypothetical protein